MNNNSKSQRKSLTARIKTEDGMQVRTNKVRGQNFLVDNTVIDRIVEQGELSGRENIVEIGPGLGALTQKLAATGCQLKAVEIEDDFVLYLRAAFISNPKVEIVKADARKLDYTTLFGEEKYILFGNLPYSITSQLVEKILTEGGNWSKLVLLLQKEAAQRIGYGIGRDNGPLSILTSYYGHSRIVFDVPGRCFNPPPAVTSAVLVVDRNEHPPVDVELDKLMRLVNAAFSNRRKTLINCLSASALPGQQEYWKEAIAACGFDRSCRAEAMNILDFAHLLEWHEQHLPE